MKDSRYKQRLPCVAMAQATVLDALSVALQHPAVVADVQILCNLLQVSRSWRQTVQQSSACIADVEFTVPWSKDGKPDITAHRFTSFSCWLPAHAGIIRSLRIYGRCFSSDCEVSMPQVAEARRMLSKALQTGALQVACPASVQDKAASPTASVTLISRPLQLQAFRGDTFGTCPEILSVLPASTLTYLWIAVSNTQCSPTCAALQQLINLRQLSIYCSESRWLSAEYVSTLHKLSRLTSLDLRDVQDSRDLQMLPQGLCELELEIDAYEIDAYEQQPVALDLSHLTRLQRLDLSFVGSVAAEAALPPYLQELRLDAWWVHPSSLSMTQLAHLQRLRIEDNMYLNAADLRYLQQLPGLQHLVLSYRHVEVAVEAASVWPQLPIKELGVASCCSVEDGIALFRSLTALNHVTSLNLQINMCSVEQLAADAVIRLFEPFKQLTKLQDLVLWVSLPDSDMGDDVDDDVDITVDPHDVLHLSCLTGLTNLYLDCHWHVHDAVPVAVLMQLNRLQSLELYFRSTTVQAMPVIGTLTRLTSLKISVPKEDQAVCLQCLTRLRNLKELEGFKHCQLHHPDVMEQFLASICA